MRWIVCVLALAGPVSAQDWQQLSGAEITEALTDVSVLYENSATQRFYASGRTLYTHGEPSWGSWRVQGDQYCSLWPPAPEWDCYDVYGDGELLDFRDEWGNTYPGEVVTD